MPSGQRYLSSPRPFLAILSGAKPVARFLGVIEGQDVACQGVHPRLNVFGSTAAKRKRLGRASLHELAWIERRGFRVTLAVCPCQMAPLKRINIPASPSARISPGCGARRSGSLSGRNVGPLMRSRDEASRPVLSLESIQRENEPKQWSVF